MRDLVVLVADTDAEWTIKTLLSQRHQSLHIREITFQVINDPNHDAGIVHNASGLLRPFVGNTKYALVLFDREGSGQEEQTAEALEDGLEEQLQKNGWTENNVRVVVLDPELEVWVWSRSPHVADALNLDQNQLNTLLASVDKHENGKPIRPKETMQQALRIGKKPHSARIFQQLASKVSLEGSERAFDRFKSTLKAWFPL